MPTQTFKVGEMLNKRTRNSKTWINFDGSYTTEIHSGLVHFEDEHGNLQNINTDLIDESELDLFDLPASKHSKNMVAFERAKVKEAKKNKNVNHDKFDFQAPLLPFSVQIPRNIKKGYSIGQNGQYIRFIPQNTSPSKGYVDREKQNKVHYQDVWNDADVILEVNENGIKETIILKTEKSPTTFTFEVTEGNINDDGTFDELKLLPAWLQDANGTKRDVEQTIRREGDKTYVDLVADVAGLVYPIEVDPTVTIQPDATAGKDSYVLGVFPDNNYGTSTNMVVGYDSNGYRETLIQFDISGIPIGADITSAKLGVIVQNVGGAGYSFNISTISQSWSESSVTWNTKPSSSAPSETVTIPAHANGSLLEWEVKNIVQKWVDETYVNNGFKFHRTENEINWILSLYTSDDTTSTNRPKLIVTYNIPPTAPTVMKPNGGETWNSLHRIEWLSSSDPENSVIDIDYIVGKGVSDATLSSSIPEVGQVITIPSLATSIKSFEAEFSAVVGQQNQISVYDIDYNVIHTETITHQTDGYIGRTFNFSNPVPVTPGVKYIIAIKWLGGANQGWKLASSGAYAGGHRVYYQSSWNIDTATDFRIRVHLEAGGLQYNIQLTTDNGANWKDIVALTTAGATYHDYDFINEAESSTAKIRIRAYDGTSYGPWDVSDGVFTIQHNQAPTSPTNLSPSGTIKDRASVIRLSWQHNDANLDPQAQFDLQWRLQGYATWNTVSQVTINQYYEVPANTFPKGVIEWQVRTYDQAGLSSPYSSISVFNTGDKPSNPTITEPTNGAIVPIANPTVQWSSVGQTGYHLKILDINNNLLWETIKTSTNKAETIQYSLENESDYKILLAIKNADGLWSDFVTIQILVSYTPPAKPTVSIEKSEATITLNISHPTPIFPQPSVTSVDIYRRKQGELNWQRIAMDLLINFVDYTLASGKTYEYKVRAYGNNGTFIESDVISTSIDIKGVWLFDTTDPTTIHKFKFDTERKGRWEANGALIQFAGRRLPVAEFDDTEANSVSVELMFTKHENDLPILLNLIKSKNTLCYRDGRGRKLYCQVFSAPVDDEIYGNSIELTFSEVSYTEEV